MAMVEIETRYPALLRSGWVSEKFVGEVVPNFRWLTGDQVCLTTGDKYFPVRVLEKKWIVSIDGARVEPRIEEPRTVVVPSSRGGEYLVTITGESRSCTCPGFTYRRTCRHVRA